jgi:hypothetical protein
MPMQPSPIAETRGPVDPSCRVITRNLQYFEFLANLPNRSQLPPFWRRSVPRDTALKCQEEASDADDGDAEVGGGLAQPPAPETSS